MTPIVVDLFEHVFGSKTVTNPWKWFLGGGYRAGQIAVCAMKFPNLIPLCWTFYAPMTTDKFFLAPGAGPNKHTEFDAIQVPEIQDVVCDGSISSRHLNSFLQIKYSICMHATHTSDTFSNPILLVSMAQHPDISIRCKGTIVYWSACSTQSKSLLEIRSHVAQLPALRPTLMMI